MSADHPLTVSLPIDQDDYRIRANHHAPTITTDAVHTEPLPSIKVRTARLDSNAHAQAMLNKASTTRVSPLTAPASPSTEAPEIGNDRKTHNHTKTSHRP